MILFLSEAAERPPDLLTHLSGELENFFFPSRLFLFSFLENLCSMKLRLEFLVTMKFVWKKKSMAVSSNVMFSCVAVQCYDKCACVCACVRDVGSFRRTCACFFFPPSFLSPVAYLCRRFSCNRRESLFWKHSPASAKTPHPNSLRKSELRQKRIGKLLPLLAEVCNPDSLPHTQ